MQEFHRIRHPAAAGYSSIFHVTEYMAEWFSKKKKKRFGEKIYIRTMYHNTLNLILQNLLEFVMLPSAKLNFRTNFLRLGSEGFLLPLPFPNH